MNNWFLVLALKWLQSREAINVWKRINDYYTRNDFTSNELQLIIRLSFNWLKLYASCYTNAIRSLIERNRYIS